MSLVVKFRGFLMAVEVGFQWRRSVWKVWVLEAWRRFFRSDSGAFLALEEGTGSWLFGVCRCAGKVPF